MDSGAIDARQLERIRATHRGFLYQHLYAAACLLKGSKTGVLRVRVELDEDVELVRADSTVYAQVKTRSSPLAPSDIQGMLERFEFIRSAHRANERPGHARFALVTNVELGPSLRGRDWPPDVLVVTPSVEEASLINTGLVVPAATAVALASFAYGLAEGFRLSALRPDSLVDKLVGLITRASAGVGDTTWFATDELSRFLRAGRRTGAAVAGCAQLSTAAP